MAIGTDMPKSERDWLASQEEARKLKSAQDKEWIRTQGAVPGTQKWYEMTDKANSEEMIRRRRDEILGEIKALETPESYDIPEDRGAIGIDRPRLRDFSRETGIYETPEGGFSNIGSIAGPRPLDRPEGQIEYDRLTGLIGGGAKGKVPEVSKRNELLIGLYTSEIEGLREAQSGLIGDDPKFAGYQEQINVLSKKAENLFRRPEPRFTKRGKAIKPGEGVTILGKTWDARDVARRSIIDPDTYEKKVRPLLSPEDQKKVDSIRESTPGGRIGQERKKRGFNGKIIARYEGIDIGIDQKTNQYVVRKNDSEPWRKPTDKESDKVHKYNITFRYQ